MVFSQAEFYARGENEGGDHMLKKLHSHVNSGYVLTSGIGTARHRGCNLHAFFSLLLFRTPSKEF
jgi:hypothetical protein